MYGWQNKAYIMVVGAFSLEVDVNQLIYVLSCNWEIAVFLQQHAKKK